MKLLKDSDTSLEPLEGKTVAILGYGNQGRAQALNLRDSGVSVIVGNRDDDYRTQAIEDGFEKLEIGEAARQADVLLILTTDESQPSIWGEQIAPEVESGNTLCWASGYNVGYELIKPSADVDVVMVAPRMTGNMVRELFERGKGAMAQYAVHQDASGHAEQTALALCKGIGLTRGGVFVSSFREEAELDLFAEQVVWAGLTSWLLQCFEVGVDMGFNPELMIMELYASGEASEILGLMARNGFFKQMLHHSTTSQYGTLSRGPRFVSEEFRAKAKEILTRDIKGGDFVKEWSDEQAGGSQRLKELMAKALEHPMSKAEHSIIPLIQAAQATEE
ncbi:MAG: ketol-acid reductoisomerase [Planctomycetota bacterium]|jgi:ketol-acid reductoisomerase|nr:ketol-acid reductoisomerase [Planctomycetota bacterium]MDP7133821.1 ketol-acid reductoisomerase [Planctomycetota bacterium]MDP7252434.1 ketol-acid reductoisomerase [Planctomycetota bacterium]